MEVPADRGRQGRYEPQSCLQILKEALVPFLTILGTRMRAILMIGTLDIRQRTLRHLNRHSSML